MAERPGRRRSRRDSLEAPQSVAGNSSRTPPGSKDRRTSRKTAGKPIKERWLLTRKTWRYMADAGRRLIPDANHNRHEDIPKIEQYFQDVCTREPRFLLWRKTSYPGSLAFRAARKRRHKAGGSCRTKPSSADEADDSRGSSSSIGVSSTPIVSGKLDLAQVKREWLLSSKEPGRELSIASPARQTKHKDPPLEDSETKALADMLQKYLNIQSDIGGIPKSTPSTTTTGDSGNSSSKASEPTTTNSFDYQKLIEKLEQHLNKIMMEGRRDEATRMAFTSTKSRNVAFSGGGSSGIGISGAIPKVTIPYQSDHIHKSLLDTLSRYYSKSPNRQHVISDILTDRKLLEKLYFDLRCTRRFRGPRATGAYTSPTARWWNQEPTTTASRTNRFSSNDDGNRHYSAGRRNLASPPPLIAIQGPSTERGPVDSHAQTDSVSRETLENLLIEREKEEQSSPPLSAKELHKSARRRSSVDNDDVSPSVSDTIKRYLRMARKKSMDADKIDRFKRVNYDRNLRNIKGKGERPSDDEGNNKGCQTDDNWILGYREMSSLEPGEAISDAETTASPASRNASSRSSIDAGLGSEETAPSTPKHHQSFLSHLLHGSHSTHKEKPHSAPGSPALTSSTNPPGGSAMQKSKSSSSVVHHGSRLVAKKIWKSRSKSSSRAINIVSAWTPQGKCTWAGTNGRRVTLQDTPLRSLLEIERKVLCRVAVAKLQALNLGVHIRPPSESLSSNSVSAKPKRRAYLLKRKALTTGFFDSKGKDDKEKEPSGGLVFGISLLQCLENDRLARLALGEINDVGCLSRSSRHGSRTSFTSLNETTTAAKAEEGGSCESLSSKGGALTGSDSGVLELSDGGPPNEWDAVPTIVKQCIRHLEMTGLNTLGIFRVSPSKKRVRQLREDWDCARETKIGPDQCPHDVAALLKEYFRDLPDPLLCRDLYQAFVHTQKIRNRRLQQEALQHLIQLLPTPNRETLYVLLNFLSEVVANSEDRKGDDGQRLSGNKMDTTNLATVFAPNILHCVKPGQARSEVSAERAEERIDVINVVRALLEHVGTLFIVPAALLDELYLHMMDSHPAELDLSLSRRADEQCADDLELNSETENYSVDEAFSSTATTFPMASTTSAISSATFATTSTTSSSTTLSTAATATAAPISNRKLYSREECLHQTAGVGGDIGPRPRRSKRPGSRKKEDSARSNSVDSGSSEDPTDPRRKSSPMVITASLTIPMSGAFTLNLDDSDIPYIEDSNNSQSKQQQQQPSAPPRRQRQCSASGSEGGGGVIGSDSAVGSSATFSGDQPPSSPLSWASTPPASPDSAVTAVSYVPDQASQHQQQQHLQQQKQPTLQRVSFTTSSELRQISRSNGQQDTSKASIAPPYTPSITSIGGAVMRSKTADIERMLHINRPDVNVRQRSSTPTTSSGVSSSTPDTKKYTKRRYTDSRHQTRHIPDAESLSSQAMTSKLSSTSCQSSTIPAAPHSSSTVTSSSSTGAAQPVWKRRELISSAPKQRGTFF
ncbi:PREDICTED: uncharacterized protein LOC105366327 [Ceratosolen solmsi marchali]|uniref:Uncharacterized protein LOC105366327 n=1 Tax=Ceratosolen solmsi marchali TaxID=326594 RepID=A0AAJ6YRT5_9HYME|nr:PREDICTED: uncharacterized protein LOC105366327 [Ceratosolen solmsi marchali]